MEWSKAKNILILVLVFANIVLLANLLKMNDDKTLLDEDYQEDAVSILELSNVYVDVETIPDRISSLPVVQIDATENLHSFARAVLGDVELLPNSVEGATMFENDSGRFLISDNFSFEFTSTGEIVEIDAFMTTVGYESADFELHTDENGANLLLNGVRVLGFGARYSDEDMARISGQLFGIENVVEEDVPLRNAVDALFVLADYFSIEQDYSGEFTVKSIDFVYRYTYSSLQGMIVLNPTYYIVGDSGSYGVDMTSLEVIALN